VWWWWCWVVVLGGGAGGAGGGAAEGIRQWKLVCKVESLGIMWDQNLLPVPQAWPGLKGKRGGLGFFGEFCWFCIVGLLSGSARWAILIL